MKTTHAQVATAAAALLLSTAAHASTTIKESGAWASFFEPARLRCFMVLASLLMSQSAVGAQAEQEVLRLRSAWNNVQHELTECAAYYNTLAVCMKVSEYDEKTVAGLRDISSEFLNRGSRAAQTIGMTADAFASRFKIAQEDQLKLIEGSCVNISSLNSRYQDRCELLLRDVKAVRDEYLKCTTRCR